MIVTKPTRYHIHHIYISHPSYISYLSYVYIPTYISLVSSERHTYWYFIASRLFLAPVLWEYKIKSCVCAVVFWKMTLIVFNVFNVSNKDRVQLDQSFITYDFVAKFLWWLSLDYQHILTYIGTHIAMWHRGPHWLSCIPHSILRTWQTLFDLHSARTLQWNRLRGQMFPISSRNQRTIQQLRMTSKHRGLADDA